MGQVRNYMLDSLKKDNKQASLYDACVSAVLEDRAQARLSKQPGFKGKWILYLEDEDTEVLEDYVLAYYLWKLDNTEFEYEKAWMFSEKMRGLFGFSAKGWGTPLLSTLMEWVDDNLQYPYFDRAKGYDNWTIKEGEPQYPVTEDIFKFACYVAVCVMKDETYSIIANKIFGHVTALGSDLPAKMKRYGSGYMPKVILEYKDNALSCKANDAFATISIRMKEESESNYNKVLEYLCKLLESDFPRSYAIDFRSPEKNYLPIKKLSKKGVHQLFANAVKYPELHSKIEEYARLAMREFEWYYNLENENCAMPGTFAVFALGMLGETYMQLVLDYIKICDGEHQSVHGEFVLAYIEKYGFTEEGLALYRLCEENIQELPSKLTALHKKAKLL